MVAVSVVDATALDEGEPLHVPDHELELRGDDRLRLRWWHSQGVRARALFRVVTDDEVAVITALGAWSVSQRSRSAPSWDVGLEPIPDGLLATLRGAGFTPAEEGDFDG